jgi:hypothetical protein
MTAGGGGRFFPAKLEGAENRTGPAAILDSRFLLFFSSSSVATKGV